MKMELVVIILTYNESIHIERAISNVLDFADQVVVLDSYSQDDTVDKAQALGAKVIFRKFDDYKNQRQYAIDYYQNSANWLLFLDADEYLTEELMLEIKQAMKNEQVAGYYMPRRFIFMNKWIKRGGYYPTYLLRLFRPADAVIDGAVNEHVIVAGKTERLKHDFVDHNLKGINDWINKHNRYATYEAKQLLHSKMNLASDNAAKFFSSQSERKQWVRYNIWNKLPLVIIRPALYFTYRYFYKLGFLDGKAGFIYHFLQGFWYWLLIDLKYLELKSSNLKGKTNILEQT